ncbi:MAG: signal peptide peptidase SppA [Bdellovibrionaceae bacterium]|nr:signal peptide peptidase SppA [Pseudobdellovibrionaceae bacterium]
MRDMFKYIVATVIGSIVGLFFCFMFFVIIVAGIFSYMGQMSSKGVSKIEDQSVLVLNFQQPLRERRDEWSYLLGTFHAPTLRQVTQAIDYAAQDSKINGIYLDLSSTAPLGWSTTKAVREALEKFKLSSKFIYAYGDYYTEGTYYLASVADKVFMHPKGEFAWDGIATVPMFYKRLFEKLGVKPVIFRVGKYKSAVEPFIQTEMSEASRIQVSALVDDLWQELISAVTTSRKLDPQDVEKMAEHLEVRTAEEALEKGMIDGLKLRSEIFEEFLIVKANDEIKKKDYDRLVGLSRYLMANKGDMFDDMGSPAELFQVSKTSEDKTEDVIALIQVEGVIMPGKSNEETTGSDDIVSQIQKAKYDKNVKGVIVRVNSPGGSALASDVIWSEIKRLREIKPVYASFGDVAASGGYYVGVAAEKIYAHPNTITGSIGVYSVLMDVQKGANEKLGLSFDRVVSHPYADRGSAVRTMSPQEVHFFQEDTNRVYRRFIEVVQSGREMDTYQDVHNIAQGRVWSGTQAKQIGLVDELGNLEDAIATLAEELKITDSYRVKEMRSEMSFGFLFSGMIHYSFLQKLPEEMKIFAQTLLNKNATYQPVKEADRVWAIAPALQIR